MTSSIKDQHVVPRNNLWAVISSNAKKATKIFQNKKRAIVFATKIAKKNQVNCIVHNNKGKFEKFNPKINKNNQHVVLNDGRWTVVTEGQNDFRRRFLNKGAALFHAYKLAKEMNGAMVIHKNDGKIRNFVKPQDNHLNSFEFFRMNLKF